MATEFEKAFERQINEFMSKLVYAGLADIENETVTDVKFSPLVYQSYGNLCLDKKDRAVSLKSRVTINTQARQIFCKAFEKMIEELTEVSLENVKDLAGLVNSISEVTLDSCMNFVVEFNNEKHHSATLKSASDTTRWFANKIQAMLANAAASQPIAVAIICQSYNTFLKSVAYCLSKLIWYHPMTINEGIILATFAQYGMPQSMLDELQQSIRPKPPTKPRKKKTTEAAEVVEAAEADDADIDGENADDELDAAISGL